MNKKSYTKAYHQFSEYGDTKGPRNYQREKNSIIYKNSKPEWHFISEQKHWKLEVNFEDIWINYCLKMRKYWIKINKLIKK